VIVSFDSRTHDDEPGWGESFGCNGLLDVLIEPGHGAPAASALEFIERCHEQEQSGGLFTVFRSEDPEVPAGTRVLTDPLGTYRIVGAVTPEAGGAFEPSIESLLDRRKNTSFVIARGGRRIDVLAEWITPPPRLFSGGSGPDAVPLARLATELGWNVTLWTLGARTEHHSRFSGCGAIAAGPLDRLTAAVNAAENPLALVMSHDFEHDSALLAAFLASKVDFVGVVGPRRRTQKLLAAIGEDSSFGDRRVRAPLGLDLGAETAEEVALSAVAEMQTFLRGASAVPLSQRRGSIHAPAELVSVVSAAGAE
jgi:xanthine/CO dehydrogenase XdhC/CoxF family maturation factor